MLCQLVGDSLLEPFWPTGSGCARGFLSALDAAWAVRAWGQTPAPHALEVIAERESIYRLLGEIFARVAQIIEFFTLITRLDRLVMTRGRERGISMGMGGDIKSPS